MPRSRSGLTIRQTRQNAQNPQGNIGPTMVKMREEGLKHNMKAIEP